MANTQNVGVIQNRKRLTSRQIKFLVGGVIVALTVGYLILSAAQGSAAYYLTITEVQAEGPSTQDVRVSGLILGESIIWEPRDLRLTFDIADEGGQLPVLYKGSRPDMFRDGAEVVVEGRMAPEGVFEARTLLLKCPSKYEEAE